MAEFEIDAYRNNAQILAVLRGRMVLQHCQDARARLNNLLSPQVDEFFLQLSGLEFLDSAGLGLFVGLKMSANRNHARLAFLAPPPRVEQIFRVAKLDTIFEILGPGEAKVIEATLMRDAHCLWSDRKDAGQAGRRTEGNWTRSGRIRPLGAGFSPPAEDGVDDRQQRLDQLCQDAVEYLRQGDYNKAIETYREVLEHDAEHLTALNNLAIVYEKRPEWYARARETWHKVQQVSKAQNDIKHAERARKHLDSLAKLIDAE